MEEEASLPGSVCFYSTPSLVWICVCRFGGTQLSDHHRRTVAHTHSDKFLILPAGHFRDQLQLTVPAMSLPREVCLFLWPPHPRQRGPNLRLVWVCPPITGFHRVSDISLMHHLSALGSYLPSTSHNCVRSHSHNKSLNSTVFIVVLLPRLNPDWWTLFSRQSFLSPWTPSVFGYHISPPSLKSEKRTPLNMSYNHNFCLSGAHLYCCRCVPPGFGNE